MDQDVGRLVGLLLAGAVTLMSIRHELGDRPNGPLLFRIALVLYVGVALIAAWALFARRDDPVRPPQGGETTVAAIEPSRPPEG